MREAGDDFVIDLEPDQDGPGRVAADEVARAVDGIDDPAAAIAGLLGGGLFSEDPVVGEEVLDDAGDEALAIAVGHGDGGEVRLGLKADTLIAVAEGDLAGPLRHGAAGVEFFP